MAKVMVAGVNLGKPRTCHGVPGHQGVEPEKKVASEVCASIPASRCTEHHFVMISVKVLK
jgi:hypothetical protein